MTKAASECAVCRRATDTYLCDNHVADVRTALLDMPHLLLDLDTTRTRQARVTSSSRGTRTKVDAEPFPYMPGRSGESSAGELSESIVATLTMWAQAIYSVRKNDDDDLHRPPRHVAALCAWLVGHVAFVAKWTEDDAHRFVVSILDLRRRYQWMVDRRPDKRFYGPCSAEVVELDLDGETIRPTTRTCTADLYGDPHRATVTCTTCRTVHDIAKRREWLLEQVLDLILPAVDIRAAFRDTAPDLARILRESTLRAWKSKGILTDVGPGRYRVREVYNELERIASRGAA